MRSLGKSWNLRRMAWDRAEEGVLLLLRRFVYNSFLNYDTSLTDTVLEEIR